MSDPMNRPVDMPPPESVPRKSASPLLWLLVLVALLVLGWYFYNQRATETVLPPAPAITEAGGTQPAPSSETPASTATRPARKADTTRPAGAARINRAPEPVARIQPEYPPQALRSREEGTVLVRVDVDANGMATNPEVVNRSGSRELDRAAMDAVRRWQFKPALKDGKAIASTVEVPVEFKLDQQ
jgi:periplasmic protein TonB